MKPRITVLAVTLVLLVVGGAAVAMATGNLPQPSGLPLGDVALPRQELAFGLGAGWKTDFSKSTVDVNQIMSGGVPRDGIPPIDNPKFVGADDASKWLQDREPVISVDINGEARAYPLQIMTWHEIVNDTLGGVPVAVTFCPLCNSAIAFDRRVEGTLYDFGTTGKLLHSDLVMWDRQTESWWQQLTGEAIVGQLAGKRLTILSASLVSWAQFRTAFPNGKVLSRDTGHARSYGKNPYDGYDDANQSPFLFRGKVDGRLRAMERVVTVSKGTQDVAYPYTTLSEQRVVHDTLSGTGLVVFWTKGTASALDKDSIPDSRDVGATGVFERTHQGRQLTFSPNGDELFRDQETGSEWDVLGRAVKGPLTGARLTPLVHGDQFWFSWAAFRPETRVYSGRP